ncbi:MAG: hypothetical protein IKP47_11480 [Ruminococcus sp.]|nr:hypothetical protein [Ruminococcus sp.]
MKTTKKSKASRKLLPAIAMLAMSATMLATSTYAWFTMNTTVTVDGFKLTAKADSTYLIIGPESTVTGLQAENRKEYTYAASAAELEVFPSAHTNAVTNTTTAGATADDKVTNWYYKYADVPTASASTSAARDIADDVFETDYVLHRTIYVTLAKGSEDASNLRCTNAEFTTTNVKTGEAETFDAVTVLVTSATALDEEDAGSNFTLGNTVLAATVTDQAVIPLDVWIYYNGNDASVFTNNVANLEGATLALEFQVDYTPAMNS